MFENVGVNGLLDAMRDAQRDERAATARRLLATGRFAQCRLTELGDQHGNWCVDDWEAVAAEVGAELGITPSWASSQMHQGVTLIERLPLLGEVFATGAVDYRVVSAAVTRTALLVDAAALGQADAQLAERAPTWNALSRRRVAEKVDWLVVNLDPDAVRVARKADEGRHIDIAPRDHGMAEVSGSLRASDAAALAQRLDEVAATVCPNDPRTWRQRRADALNTITAGGTALACECGAAECPARTDGVAASKVVVHVIAEEATVTGGGVKPALIPGFGAVPAEAVRRLAKAATVRPVTKDFVTGNGYRPSAALADFLRCRDLTCRFPGCDQPAQRCDIDHTVPYPAGPTHASNLKLYCRKHHLLKTFYIGAGGWRDTQQPDGTVTWTSPTGRRYTTTPDGALYFPALRGPTGALPSAPPAAPATGGLALMPVRRQSRAQERAYRIERERGLNRARNVPPF
jgi:hypothetical protein